MRKTQIYSSLQQFIVLLLIFVATQTYAGIVVLQTDFGTKDGAVSEMKGVIYSVNLNTIVSDLTHEIQTFDISEAAYRLCQAFPYWSKGTVFVSVVDPGVGTARKSIVAKSKNGYYFVTPDNGTLTYIDHKYGIEEVREIDETQHRLPRSKESHTFFGRDVYAYTAAKLSSGIISFHDVGKILKQPIVKLPISLPQLHNGILRGSIVAFDPQYGNIWTNINKAEFEQFGAKQNAIYHVQIFRHGRLIYSTNLPFKHTFGEVKIGDGLVYLNSNLEVALAINQGNFMKHYKIQKNDEIVMRKIL